MRALRRTGLAVGGVAALGLAGAAYGFAEASCYAVRRHHLPVLPAGSAPLRVLHLSDIHLLPWQRRKIGWVRQLAQLRPDVVVNTGDNISAEASIGLLLEALEPLLHVPGVFVPGSNDYYAPKPANPLRYFAGPSKVEGERRRLPHDDLFSAFRAAGWADLTNRRETLRIAAGAHTVEILAAGTDDPHLRLDRWPGFGTRAGAAGEPVFRLGVTHAPYTRVLDAMVTDGADLILAGHTHGGQICLPFYGALVTNCDLPRAQASGVSRWTAGGRTVPLEVSAGIGAAATMPLRVACRPEAVVLELTQRRDGVQA
ncbi:MAG: metallophosphoesterase [Micrococcus sp.]|nr:metallophosphoesterase [Micrococcus sp.]